MLLCLFYYYGRVLCESRDRGRLSGASLRHVSAALRFGLKKKNRGRREPIGLDSVLPGLYCKRIVESAMTAHAILFACLVASSSFLASQVQANQCMSDGDKVTCFSCDSRSNPGCHDDRFDPWATSQVECSGCCAVGGRRRGGGDGRRSPLHRPDAHRPAGVGGRRRRLHYREQRQRAHVLLPRGLVQRGQGDQGGGRGGHGERHVDSAYALDAI